MLTLTPHVVNLLLQFNQRTTTERSVNHKGKGLVKPTTYSSSVDASKLAQVSSLGLNQYLGKLFDNEEMLKG